MTGQKSNLNPFYIEQANSYYEEDYDEEDYDEGDFGYDDDDEEEVMGLLRKDKHSGDNIFARHIQQSTKKRRLGQPRRLFRRRCLFVAALAILLVLALVSLSGESQSSATDNHLTVGSNDEKGVHEDSTLKRTVSPTKTPTPADPSTDTLPGNLSIEETKLPPPLSSENQDSNKTEPLQTQAPTTATTANRDGINNDTVRANTTEENRQQTTQVSTSNATKTTEVSSTIDTTSQAQTEGLNTPDAGSTINSINLTKSQLGTQNQNATRKIIDLYSSPSESEISASNSQNQSAMRNHARTSAAGRRNVSDSDSGKSGSEK